MHSGCIKASLNTANFSMLFSKSSSFFLLYAGYQDKHKRPSFLESVEGKAVIAGCGIICLALISLVTLLVFCHIRKGLWLNNL